MDFSNTFTPKSTDAQAFPAFPSMLDDYYRDLFLNGEIDFNALNSQADSQESGKHQNDSKDTTASNSAKIQRNKTLIMNAGNDMRCEWQRYYKQLDEEFYNFMKTMQWALDKYIHCNWSVTSIDDRIFLNIDECLAKFLIYTSNEKNLHAAIISNTFQIIIQYRHYMKYQSPAVLVNGRLYTYSSSYPENMMLYANSFYHYCMKLVTDGKLIYNAEVPLDKKEMEQMIICILSKLSTYLKGQRIIAFGLC